MAPRALVTGGSGLLGQCLIARLEERGVAVRALDLVPPPPDGRGGEELVIADCRDSQAVERAATGCDAIYHLAAAQRMKPQFRGVPERTIHDMNLKGTATVLVAAERAGVRKLVFVSSSGVYGLPPSHPIGEEHPLRPLGAYGRSKVEAEELCRAACERGLDVTILRPMSLFGPRMTGVFTLLFEWVRSGKNVYLLGRGSNRVQMVSAWDVAEACLLAAERPAARGGVFNLGADEVPTVRAQVEGLIAHAGSRSRVVPLPAGALRTAARFLHLLGLSPLVPEHYLLADRTFILDCRRAREVLGWRPRESNLQMTISAYEWYAAHWQTHRPAPSLVLRALDALS